MPQKSPSATEFRKTLSLLQKYPCVTRQGVAGYNGWRITLAVDLRDLRWMIAASQHRSLRQAAESLTIRQSTLSRRLRDIEDHLGTTLFERTHAGIRPTTIGREFLDIARRIVEETDTAFVRLKARCGGESGPLSIGIYAALSAGNLRATIMEHQRRHPSVEIRAVDGARHHLLSELAAGVIDVAIVTADESLWAERKLSLWTERVVVALPEDHPLCSIGILHWADLRAVPILLTRRDPGPEFQHLLMVKLGHQNGARINDHEVALDRLMSLVGAGLGLTLVAEGATGAVYSGVTYREIHDNDGSPTRLNFMACWRHANDNPALGGFLAILRERYPDLAVASVETGA